MNITAKDVARFMRKFQAKGPDDCWPWKAGTFHTGYGAFYCDGQNRLASRISHLLLKAEDPGEAWVLHTCDNPLCINPAHLFPGDAQANSDDTVSKGRQARGEMMFQAKLTDEDVRYIRTNYKPGKVRLLDLAIKFGVSIPTIGYIVRRQTWRHVMSA